uniref:Transmembrane protein 236 n=1 Tax=Sander lucioperca TaxID=283035 RepID=A0A8C9WX75_SANLU
MPSGKTVKLVLYEVLQLAALIVPIFVIMERFASLIHDVRGGDLTAYWLVVAASIAYVTSVTLLVWVPLKYLILKRQRGHRIDHFIELPVSLVLFSLICVDVIERIRPFRLVGQRKFCSRWYSYNLNDVEVYMFSPSTAYLYSSSPRQRSYSGSLGFLLRRDGRSEVFVDSFLFWLDTVEMVRVAGEPSVFYSAWVFPVYIFAFMSTLRMVITPHNPLLSSAGVALQDLPFFIIRVALIVVFGYITPVLYTLKNVLVSLTFIYFTFLTRLRIFRRQSMF